MIHYVMGDATNPKEARAVANDTCLVHVCNNRGFWGAGFTRPLSQRWPAAEEAYRSMPDWRLGQMVFVRVAPDLVIVNLIAQDGIRPSPGRPAVQYEVLRNTLHRLNASLVEGENIAMPRIGAGLGGGSWAAVECILKEVLTCDVFVYTRPGDKWNP